MVCTSAGIFSGDTFRLEEQRLLDALNRGFVARALRMAGDFMPLVDVEFHPLSGRKIGLSAIHVHKAGILLVAEKKSGTRETAAGCPENRKARLLRPKTPVAAELYVPPYVLEGNIYVESWGDLPGTIETDSRFMPLTDVTLRPAVTGGESAFGFVAVNRERILYISEVPARVQSGSPPFSHVQPQVGSPPAKLT